MSYPYKLQPANSTLYHYFGSYAATTGAPSATTNLAVGDILIYKNGSTTQRASTNGFTLLDTDGLDFDGTTGINGFSVDLSDDTTAGFYEVGASYTIVITPVTIDSQTMSFVACEFRIIPEEITGTVSAITDDTHLTLATGKNIRKGWFLHITYGNGIGQWAIVNSYTSGTGATVLETPGFTTNPNTSSKYLAIGGPNVPAIPVNGSNNPQVDVVAINAATVTGIGTSGDKWRAA